MPDGTEIEKSETHIYDNFWRTSDGQIFDPKETLNETKKNLNKVVNPKIKAKSKNDKIIQESFSYGPKSPMSDEQVENQMKELFGNNLPLLD